jgi:hypothetical protein
MCTHTRRSVWTKVVLDKQLFLNLRFHVLTAAGVKMTAFWDIAPCSVVEVDRRLKDAY